MKKLFEKLDFIRVPLQLAAGVYMAVMLIFGTAAALVHFDDDLDQCGELEMSNHPKPAVIFEMSGIWNS
ncbi:hypothetical protein N8500_09865 [Candidatus Puniceispirillum sp.]|nr:hypothetical protein [Candidatus Puniceispirillum sp.]